MTDHELQQKRKKIEDFVKYGVLAGALGLIVVPVVLQAAFGLAVLAVIGFTAVVGVNLAPTIGSRLANMRLKLLKAEAARNPIETLQLEFGRRQEALERGRENINKFAAAVATFEGKLDNFKEQFPKDTPKFDENFSKMTRLLALRRLKYGEAKGALEQFDGEIQRASAIWTMAQEAAKLHQAAGMTDDDFQAKVKTETALDSVTTSMNVAFAELETSLLDEEQSQPHVRPAELTETKRKALSAGPQLVVDAEIVSETAQVEKGRTR